MTGVSLLSVQRIAVFVHPGQLKSGSVHLVTLCDANSHFEEDLKTWRDQGAVCLYDGPPVPPCRRCGGTGKVRPAGWSDGRGGVDHSAWDPCGCCGGRV